MELILVGGPEQVPHPLAAILALTQLMEVSTGKPLPQLPSHLFQLTKYPHVLERTASTLTGLLTELVSARQKLVDTQPSLGVRAGCQLFERFVSSSGAGEVSGRDSPSQIHRRVSSSSSSHSLCPSCVDHLPSHNATVLRYTTFDLPRRRTSRPTKDH